MKRTHRSAHRLIWLLLAPILAAIVIIALQVRPAAPVNDALPEALSEEAS